MALLHHRSQALHSTPLSLVLPILTRKVLKNFSPLLCEQQLCVLRLPAVPTILQILNRLEGVVPLVIMALLLQTEIEFGRNLIEPVQLEVRVNEPVPPVVQVLVPQRQLLTRKKLIPLLLELLASG
jgi:hypothetical protein